MGRRRLASAWRAASQARSRASLTQDGTPNGCFGRTRTFLGAPPTPRFGVSEAKVQTPGAGMRRGNEEVCVLEIVRPGIEESESAEKQENTGTGPASACLLILRSAHAQALSRSRTRVRAPRRMRTCDWVLPHASRRIAAQPRPRASVLPFALRCSSA